MNDLKNELKDLVIAALVGTLCTVGGFYLCFGKGTQLGYALFVVSPIVTGFSVGIVTNFGRVLFSATILSLFFSFFYLIWWRLESILCCVLAFAIIVICMFLGAVIGYLLKKFIFKKDLSNNNLNKLLMIIVAFFFLTGANYIEKPYITQPRLVSVTTEYLSPLNVKTTWEMLKEVDQLDAPQSWMFWAGLPLPQRCELRRAEVGGERICYFKKGYIREKITEWNPPYQMKLKIVQTTIPGRKWLVFNDAEYKFETVKEGTRIIRTTTIFSHLYPKWYWEPFEKMGIAEEHKYLFADFDRRLKNKKI